MIAFDSNLLIYLVDGNPEYYQRAVELFYEIEQVGGVCSSLVITEAMYAEINSLAKLTPLQSPSIQVIPVTPAIAELAGKIKLKHSIKNVDAIHIATAIDAKASVFITNDDQLLKKTIPGIIIKGL